MFSHPVVPVAIALVAGRGRIPTPLLAAGIVASVLPDADVIGFNFGIPYGHLLGHRGFFHSLFFSFACAMIGALVSRRLGVNPMGAFAFLFFSMAFHGLLDATTNGGLGIAFFSPFSNHRYFLPWQPIVVSPLSATRFFSAEALPVMWSEMKWVWLPFLSVGAVGLVVRRACGG